MYFHNLKQENCHQVLRYPMKAFSFVISPNRENHQCPVNIWSCSWLNWCFKPIRFNYDSNNICHLQTCSPLLSLISFQCASSSSPLWFRPVSNKVKYIWTVANINGNEQYTKWGHQWIVVDNLGVGPTSYRCPWRRRNWYDRIFKEKPIA